MDAPEQERLEDVFQDDVIKRFPTTPDFFKFAKSKHGLCLDHLEIQHIAEDHRFSVEEQKVHLLEKWRQNLGTAASPQLIREIVENYLRRKQVNSDATTGEDRSSPESEEPPATTQFITGQTGGSEGSVNVFNINAPINGPFLAGNEKVTLGAGVVAQGPAAIDQDVPPLKPSATEISPDGTDIVIGGCTLGFPSQAVRELTEVFLSSFVDPGPPPDGFIHASSMLSCVPIFQGRKNVKVDMDTWCLTERSVEAGIFSKNDEGNWDRIDGAFLTDEGRFELQYRSVNNLAAFIPADRAADVRFKISCFLFNDANGKFAMGFCLADEAIENVFKHKMKKEHPFESIKNLDHLFAYVGDEIFFKITPGQEMQNTKLDIDMDFVATFQGYVSYCKPDKDYDSAHYEITQYRGGVTIAEHKKRIPGKNPTPTNARLGASFSGRDTNVDFRGNLRAENFLGSVENADIDMREYGDHSDDGEDGKPFWKENNKLTYEEAQKKKERALKKKDEILARHRREGRLPDNTPRRSGRTNITFHGDVEARTVITDAKNVRIDQRRFKGKRGAKPPAQPKVERLVKAEQDRGGGGVEQSDEEEKLESRQGPRAESGELPDSFNKAQPIWDDCEKKDSDKSSKDSKKSGEAVSGMEQSLHEPSMQDDMAQPFVDHTAPKEPSDTDPDEEEVQGAVGGVPEVDVLRERKKKKNVEKEKRDSNGENREVNTIDGLHIFLGLIIVLCLGFIAFSSYK